MPAMMKEPRNPYLGFSVTLASYRFHCSPSMLTVWEKGGEKRLLDGPTRIGYTPRTNEQLIDIGLRWIRENIVGTTPRG